MRAPSPARADYRVFVHVESIGKGCGDIVLSGDHTPQTPTTAWPPNEVVVDGPRLLTVPAGLAEAEYAVHVGIFDADGAGQRLLDAQGGRVRVSRSAAAAESLGPPPLARWKSCGGGRPTRSGYPPRRAWASTRLPAALISTAVAARGSLSTGPAA